MICRFVMFLTERRMEHEYKLLWGVDEVALNREAKRGWRVVGYDWAEDDSEFDFRRVLLERTVEVETQEVYGLATGYAGG